MTIPEDDWRAYVRRLRAVDSHAADLVTHWIEVNGTANMEALTQYVHSVVTAYGEASAALSCEMYDEIASLSGVSVPAAVPAATATYSEVWAMVKEVLDTAESMLGPAAGRQVKQAGADTMLKNALRDGAQFAWVPLGDTCAFCLTLASRGWQYASKTTIKGGHAEHIHANCDCQFAIRFNENTRLGGYEPDTYLRLYDDADGIKPQDKINAIRRDLYQQNKDQINAQKRAAYAARKEDQ